MKEIFQRKTFWALLIILLLAVFVYPPFLHRYRNGSVSHRSWEWFAEGMGEVDLKMLLVGAIIAILLTIGIFLIPFIPFKKIGFTIRSNIYLKMALVIIMALIPIFWGLSKYHDFVQKQRLKKMEIKKFEQTGKELDEQALRRAIEEIRQRIKQEEGTKKSSRE